MSAPKSFQLWNVQRVAQVGVGVIFLFLCAVGGERGLSLRRLTAAHIRHGFYLNALFHRQRLVLCVERLV